MSSMKVLLFNCLFSDQLDSYLWVPVKTVNIIQVSKYNTSHKYENIWAKNESMDKGFYDDKLWTCSKGYHHSYQAKVWTTDEMNKFKNELNSVPCSVCPATVGENVLSIKQ